MKRQVIETDRLRLNSWEERHLEAFSEMHADAEVMADFGGPLDFSSSLAKFERYLDALRIHGVSRWAVEDREGRFLGYAGVMPRLTSDHPLGPHHEIGWRFQRSAWGHGYATESARAALEHAHSSLGLTGIIAYTGPDNTRSQSVMRKLGLTRRPMFDFVQNIEGGRTWSGLVWAVDE